MGHFSLFSSCAVLSVLTWFDWSHLPGRSQCWQWSAQRDHCVCQSAHPTSGKPWPERAIQCYSCPSCHIRLFHPFIHVHGGGVITVPWTHSNLSTERLNSKNILNSLICYEPNIAYFFCRSLPFKIIAIELFSLFQVFAFSFSHQRTVQCMVYYSIYTYM